MRRLSLVLILASGCGRFGFDTDAVEPVAIDFRVDWVTANTIRWTWTDTASLDLNIGGLELAVADSPRALASGDAVVFTPRINPELGFLDDETITDDLQPDTAYAAQLRILDPTGQVIAVSAEVAEAMTTPLPVREILIFSDEPTEGYSIPDTLVHSDRGAFAGTHCYSFVSTCDSDEAQCFENLRRQGIDHDLSVIDTGSWPAAFVEWAMAAGGPDNSEFSQVRLMMRDRTTDATRVFSRGSFTIRGDGGYRLYQVPLAELIDMDEPLDPSIAASHSVFEFGVGGSFTAGSTVRLDEVRIRY